MECYKIKYHKGNFKQNTKCRLSKKRYRTSQENVYCTDYRDVNNITKFNQWRNTSTVIKWFQNITNKNNCRFIKFDISEFYPSISEEVLEKSIIFANGITNIDDRTIQIIKHARKSLLFDSAGVWVQNDDNPLFDVTMGSFDGA